MKAEIVKIVREVIEIDLRDFMSQVEVARKVGVTESAVRTAMDAGRIPAVFWGKRRGTLRSAVNAWIERRQAKNA